MARAMRIGALLLALIVLAGYSGVAFAKKDKKHKAPAPAPEAVPTFSYTPAAEALIKAAKAPGQDAGSYINAAKRVAPGPEASMHVDQMIAQEEATSTPGETANLQAGQTAANANPNLAG
ncbi:hypothetical protein CVIRNUC_008785 [Coccomyxa viridis]|uniref:DUF4148 domain-containing protein n=1 Tax=Coccomyxa viridis TaxID=1274662 RepID=A0AAV1IGI4_9CHLO|nr:hypothetical protein CVIRNUC_008785 [Coccomyxa viridis]